MFSLVASFIVTPTPTLAPAVATTCLSQPHSQASTPERADVEPAAHPEEPLEKELLKVATRYQLYDRAKEYACLGMVADKDAAKQTWWKHGGQAHREKYKQQGVKFEIQQSPGIQTRILEALSLLYVRCRTGGAEGPPSGAPWEGTILQATEEMLFNIRHGYARHQLNAMRQVKLLVGEEPSPPNYPFGAMIVTIAPCDAKFFHAALNLCALAQNDLVRELSEDDVQRCKAAGWKLNEYSKTPLNDFQPTPGQKNLPIIYDEAPQAGIPGMVIVDKTALTEKVPKIYEETESRALAAFANCMDLKEACQMCGQLRKEEEQQEAGAGPLSEFALRLNGVRAAAAVCAVYRVTSSGMRSNRKIGGARSLFEPDGFGRDFPASNALSHDCRPGSPLSVTPGTLATAVFPWSYYEAEKKAGQKRTKKKPKAMSSAERRDGYSLAISNLRKQAEFIYAKSINDLDKLIKKEELPICVDTDGKMPINGYSGTIGELLDKAAPLGTTRGQLMCRPPSDSDDGVKITTSDDERIPALDGHDPADDADDTEEFDASAESPQLWLSGEVPR